MKDSQVSRRMSELERDDWVWKDGTKSKTSSGHDAFNYQLTQKGKDFLIDTDVKKETTGEIIPPIKPMIAKTQTLFE